MNIDINSRCGCGPGTKGNQPTRPIIKPKR